MQFRSPPPPTNSPLSNRVVGASSILKCGPPPPELELENRWQERELGSYPTIVLAWEDGMRGAPDEYLHKCEEALEELDRDNQKCARTSFRMPVSRKTPLAGRCSQAARPLPRATWDRFLGNPARFGIALRWLFETLTPCPGQEARLRQQFGSAKVSENP
jgi:hypothetical protein